MSQCQAGCALSIVCFNGAAPARGRNVSWLEIRIPSSIKLQRGRARAGAECFPSTPLRPQRLAASTGPRPRGRGMKVDHEPNGHCRYGFNGGAPARALNVRNAEWGVGHSEASTGPRPRGRGMGLARPQPQIIRQASTGPRPRGRGMRAGHYRHVVADGGLQRGRARAGAECNNRFAQLDFYLVLQRGRARAGAECHSRRLSQSGSLTASTGPRPRGRGMLDSAGLAADASAASTGPRPRGRGMSLEAICQRLPPRASPGPRPRGRGMNFYFLWG